jgi:hypothetical protein
MVNLTLKKVKPTAAYCRGLNDYEFLSGKPDSPRKRRLKQLGLGNDGKSFF